jgi:multidrug efflux pump subunit AcrA (membrane-fusion protein)
MSTSPIANIDDKTSLVLGKRNDNFLAKAILLEEATPPSYMRTTIKLATYSLVIFLIWSFFANLDVVANAAGQVTPIQSVKILQHVDGGRISAINVVDGQRVVEGQVLMRFNATEPTVEFETLNVKFWGLFAKVESLRALLEKREPDYSRVPKQYSQLVADQRRTLTAARNQIDQIGAEIKILTEVSSIRGGLAQEKLATRVQALDAERSVGQAQAELLRYRKANMDDLAASSNEMAQTEEQLAKMRDRLERIEVLSPVDGIVQDLKFRTVGGVVPPATVLMNVVPTDGGMHAEVRVSPNDIGFVKVGQKARVKINAYDFMRYGSVEGTVVMISPFSTFDEKQQPYFKVIVSLPKSVVGGDPSKTIQPGMTVQTDVITDKQSVLRYLTRPIYVAFHQGLRER